MEPISHQETELWLRSSRNDLQAQTELFQMYLHLVDAVALRLKRRLPAHIQTDDLRSAGQEALWKSMLAFSRDRGVPFAAYAARRIRGAMLDELRRMDDLTRTQRLRWKQAQSAYGSLCESQSATSVSLDDGQRYDWIVDDAALSPEEHAIQADELSALHRALLRLSEQQQVVLALVFNEGLNLAEAAEVLDLSRSRVTKIYHEALKSLKGMLLRQR